MCSVNHNVSTVSNFTTVLHVYQMLQFIFGCHNMRFPTASIIMQINTRRSCGADYCVLHISFACLKSYQGTCYGDVLA